MADLLYAGVLERFTGEQFSEEFEFSGYIPASTTVNTATVTITSVDGTDVTSSVFVSKSISSTTVTVTLNTGSTETGYLVKVAVVASDLTPQVQTKLLNVTSPGIYR